MRPPPPPYPQDLREAAARTAAQAAVFWTPGPGRVRPGHRIGATAALVWRTAYPIAYAHGYNTLTYRAGPTFAELHHQLLAKAQAPSHDMHALRVIAETAPTIIAAGNELVPMPREVLRTAVNAAVNSDDGPPPARAVAFAVHTRSAKIGGVCGALEAAADIEATWHLMAGTQEDTTNQVHERLAALNRDFITEWMNEDHLPGGPATLADTSFARPAAAAPGTSVPRTVDPAGRRIPRFWHRR